MEKGMGAGNCFIFSCLPEDILLKMNPLKILTLILQLTDIMVTFWQERRIVEKIKK